MTDPVPQSFAIKSTRVVVPGGITGATIRARDGRITSVDENSGPRTLDRDVIDVGDAMILPGLVDTHVHVNEPGRTEWEGFETATRAAAAGGVTTILDMPLNAIPATTDATALAVKRKAADGKCHIDVGFIGGVVPGNADALGDLAAAGVLAWKCFLVDSGVPEFPPVDEQDLRRAMPILARFGRPLMVHAELPGPITQAQRSGRIRTYADYLASRPERAELEAIALMIRLASEYDVPVHIVHLASREALPLLEEARARGVRMTVETCPHYLTFVAEDIPDGATEYKCAPPIRSASHREALWRALERGTIDMIASDHSPAPAELRRREEGDFAAAWGGIASLQLGLSAVRSSTRGRHAGIARIVSWMAARPAAITGLTRKGRIAVGCDADLVIWDPDAEWTVNGSRLQHRHPLTPYHGMRLPGRVLATYLRGRRVYDGGVFSAPPSGRFLLPDE
jgi:allantoinase